MNAEQIRSALGIDTANKLINEGDSTPVQTNKLMILMLTNLNEMTAQLAELNQHVARFVQPLPEQPAGLIRVETFTPFDSKLNNASGTYSESWVVGSPVRIDKGHWDDQQQDWRARITYSGGAVVNTSYWYGPTVEEFLKGKK